MSSDFEIEKIAEFLEEHDSASATHHTLYFDPDGGRFVLESIGVAFNDGDVALEDLAADEALDWLVEVAGMPYMKAVRAIIGTDEDTPR